MGLMASYIFCIVLQTIVGAVGDGEEWKEALNQVLGLSQITANLDIRGLSLPLPNPLYFSHLISMASYDFDMFSEGWAWARAVFLLLPAALILNLVIAVVRR